MDGSAKRLFTANAREGWIRLISVSSIVLGLGLGLSVDRRVLAVASDATL
jgi:hypothetical protein